MEKEKRKNEAARPNIFMMILGFIGKILNGIGSGAWWLLSHIANGAWWGLKQVGNGLLWSLQHIGSFGFWLLKQPYRLLRYIISGRIPEFENARQEEIFWRIKRQFRRKRLFAINTVFFAIAIIIALVFNGVNFYQYSSYSTEWTLRALINGLTTSGVILGVWIAILTFHHFFNKMGDAEDTALGDALENEYARSEIREEYARGRGQKAPIDRLIESPQDDYDYYDDEEEKPKRNGARL